MGLTRAKKDNKPLFSFISHYYDSDNPVTGGEKYNFRLVEALRKEGYPLAIYTDDKIPGIVKKSYVLYDLWFLLHVVKFKNCILLIDDYMHPRLFIFLFLLKRLTGVKVIGTVHHLYWCIQKNRIRRWLDKLIESIFISQFDHLIVPSAYTLNSVKEIVGRMPHAHIIQPAVERPNRGSFSKKRKYVQGKRVKLLFVGAIQQRKGVIELIRALSKVTYKDIFLYLVGDIDQRPEYVEKVKGIIGDHNLIDRVRLCGRISTEELNRLYQEADIFILPSFHEGYGIVVAEAMQFGLPAIVSNITALPELIQEGVNGLLVTPGDVDEIAKAIDELSWSPEKRRLFANRSFEFAKKINTWEMVEKKFLMLISQMLESVQ
jgi:glycosyltransferase involved in cell wall biosynthesis